MSNSVYYSGLYRIKSYIDKTVGLLYTFSDTSGKHLTKMSNSVYYSGLYRIKSYMDKTVGLLYTFSDTSGKHLTKCQTQCITVA